MLAGRVSLAGGPDSFYLGKVDVILDCRHSLTFELCRFSLAVVLVLVPCHCHPSMV